MFTPSTVLHSHAQCNSMSSVNDSNSLHLLSTVKIVYAMDTREFTACEKTYPKHLYGQSIGFKVLFLKFI